jgi:hypothetical protein
VIFPYIHIMYFDQLTSSITLSYPPHPLFHLLLSALEFELRGSHLLSKRSTTWATPPALFALVIFQIGSQGWPYTMILLPIIFLIAGITGVPHYAQLVDWDEVSLTFCLGLEPWSSQVIWILEVNYHAHLFKKFLMGFITLYLCMHLKYSDQFTPLSFHPLPSCWFSAPNSPYLY